jgi:hypothetical protein
VEPVVYFLAIIYFVRSWLREQLRLAGATAFAAALAETADEGYEGGTLGPLAAAGWRGQRRPG